MKILLLFECLFSLLRLFFPASWFVIKLARFVWKYYFTLGTFHQFFIYIARPSCWFFLWFLISTFSFSLIQHFLRFGYEMKHHGSFFTAARQKHVIVWLAIRRLRVSAYNWALIAFITWRIFGYYLVLINDWFTQKLFRSLVFDVCSCSKGW